MSDFEEIWRRIRLGQASTEDKIAAIGHVSETLDFSKVEDLIRLVDDRDPDVRDFSLQALVLDLGIKNSVAKEACWRLLESDPEEDVRMSAASCLGNIMFNSKDVGAFRRLCDKLMDAAESAYVKEAIYNGILQLAGRSPLEWSGLGQSRAAFTESSIDWQKISEIQAEIGLSPTKNGRA